MPAPVPVDLAARWLELCRRLAPTASESLIQSQLDVLVASYQAFGLPYHNLSHIAACLRELDAQRCDAAAADQVEFALWLHDAIYDPTRRDNEARSAELAASVATQLGLPADWIEDCRGLILATRHAEGPQTADQRLICDVDLSILAAPPEEYDAYRQAIRSEYAFAGDADFRAGRAQFLRSMLARPSIFHTQRYRAAAEVTARANLARELNRIDSP